MLQTDNLSTVGISCVSRSYRNAYTRRFQGQKIQIAKAFCSPSRKSRKLCSAAKEMTQGIHHLNQEEIRKGAFILLRKLFQRGGNVEPSLEQTLRDLHICFICWRRRLEPKQFHLSSNFKASKSVATTPWDNGHGHFLVLVGYD